MSALNASISVAGALFETTARSHEAAGPSGAGPASDPGTSPDPDVLVDDGEGADDGPAGVTPSLPHAPTSAPTATVTANATTDATAEEGRVHTACFTPVSCLHDPPRSRKKRSNVTQN